MMFRLSVTALPLLLVNLALLPVRAADPAPVPPKLVAEPQKAQIFKKGFKKPDSVWLVTLTSEGVEFKNDANQDKALAYTARSGTITGIELANGRKFAINPASKAYEEYDPTTSSFIDRAAKEPDEARKVDDAPAMPDEPRSQRVVAEGVGATAEDALKDALRSAVSQVVGAVVDAETLVKNDEVINDKVLTFSGGLVTKYDEISKKQDKGLVRIKISAEVERRKIVERLRTANITIKGVEGKDLAATVLTRVEARKNAAELLSKAIADLPKTMVAEVAKPTARDYDEDTKRLKLTVTVRFDMEKYKAFAKRLSEICDKVSLGEHTRGLTALPYKSLATGKKKPIKEPSDLPDDALTFSEPVSFTDLGVGCGEKTWGLWMLTQADEQFLRTRWKCYMLDSNPTKTLSSLAGSVKAHLIAMDSTGEPLVEEEFDLNSSHEHDLLWDWGGLLIESGRKGGMQGSVFDQEPPDRGMRRSSQLNQSSFGRYRPVALSFTEDDAKDKRKIFALICPFVLMKSIWHGELHSPRFCFPIKVPLTAANLAKMKDIKCAVEFKPTHPTDRNE